MIPHEVRALAQILLKQKASCSTAVVPQNLLPLIRKLSKEYTDIGRIVKCMKEKDFKNIHFDEWKSRIDLLKLYEFTESECFRMISKYGGLLEIPIDNFKDTIEQWYQSSLGVKNFQLALKTRPELIDINVSEIEKRMPYLESYCKDNVLTELLIVSPNVMSDDWMSVLSKIDYLAKKKRYSFREIVRSGAFSIPMDFIEFRFDLLEKCGIYKEDKRPIHKINKYDKTAHQNPRLRNILSDTEVFVKVAQISTEEYQTCKDLFMSETHDEEEDEINTYNK